MSTILLRCLKPGCPRKKRVSSALFPEVPPNTTEVHSYCPWHDGRCDKGYPEYYYDADGNELDWETGQPKLAHAEKLMEGK